ncbi:MAG: AAA family ATPase [Lachnospiraceae bacterium]
MEKKVISVTRQFGSLGRMIAKQVAAKMGFEYYDREIIEKAAEEMGEPIYKLSEYDGHSYSTYGKMMFPLGYGIRKKQKQLFEIEKRVITNLARTNDCVIVGRCSDYIMSEENIENHYSVFIYASYNARFHYCLDILGLTPEAAEVYMEKVDKAREQFYLEQTAEKFTSIKYRNLFVDSSAMSIEKTVELICHSAALKFGE